MENKFRSQQEVALHLEAVREATNNLKIASLITLDIVRKFDGKQFTRRITNLAQKAVDEVLGENVVSVGFDLTEFHFGVEFYLYKRSYIVKRPRFNQEFTEAVYFDQDIWKSVTCYNGSRYALDASEFEKRTAEMVKANALTVYKFADAAEHFAEYQQAYLNAVDDFQMACGDINPLFLERMVYTTDTRISRAWQDRAEKAIQQ